MSGRIDKIEEKQFEDWIIKNYPELFSEWEDDCSEFMDIDCWIYESHSEIFREYQRKFHSIKNKQE